MLTITNILHRISLWIVIAFLCSFLVRTMLLADVNKRVYNHAPGQCRYLPELDSGAPGMELTSSDEIIISVGAKDATRPGIVLFPLKDNQYYKSHRLNIEGNDFTENHFLPKSLTSYESKGRISLYAVNHYPGQEGLEFFTFVRDKKTLFHRRSLRDPDLLPSITGVVAVGPDRLFITNLARFTNPFLKISELLLQSNTGSLLFFDGKGLKVVDPSIPSPSSVAYDSERKILYVGSYLNEIVRVYKVKRDLSVEFLHDISLLSSPTGLFVEESTGDLWVTLHPVLYQAVLHHKDPKTVSPSQVLRIRMQEDGKSWVITEPYSNDGASVCASSALVYHQEYLLIGGLSGKALLCDVNKDLIT